GAQAETAAAARVVEADTKRVQEPVRGVAETREVEGDREVIVVVHLPATHDAAIRLEPAAHSVPPELVHKRVSAGGPHPRAGLQRAQRVRLGRRAPALRRPAARTEDPRFPSADEPI